MFQRRRSHPLKRQALSTFLLTSKMCLPPRCGPVFSPSLGRKSGSNGADPRRSHAADGGTAAGHHAFLRHASACSRAGYRSAQDLVRRCPCVHRCARYAAGGTAGGSADDRILFLAAADYGAERRHSSSWSWRANYWSSRFSPWTEFNSAVLVRNAFLSGLWSRSLISPFLVEAFNSFAQDRVPQRLPRFLLDTLMKGFFFALFPKIKKVRRSRAPRGRNWVRTLLHPRRRLRRPIRGTTWSVSRHGSATWTAVAALTGAYSERATPNGSPRGSAGREGASDSVRRRVVVQFQFLDKVVVGVGWGAAALSRWCRLCQGAACQSWRLLEEFPLPRCRPCRAVCTWKSGHYFYVQSCGGGRWVSAALTHFSRSSRLSRS